MQIPTITASVWFVASATLLAACGSETPQAPANWSESYSEVRACRRSGEHDLNFVRVFAAPGITEAYRSRSGPLPADETILKVEYADPDCREVTGYTSMRKDADPAFRDSDGWRFQRTNLSREVIDLDKEARCIGCHRACQAPDGHDWTCTDP